MFYIIYSVSPRVQHWWFMIRTAAALNLRLNSNAALVDLCADHLKDTLCV